MKRFKSTISGDTYCSKKPKTGGLSIASQVAFTKKQDQSTHAITPYGRNEWSSTFDVPVDSNLLPDPLEVTLDDEISLPEAECMPRSTRPPIDYSDSSYTTFDATWIGWKGLPVKCATHVLDHFTREFPGVLDKENKDTGGDVGLLLAFICDHRFDVLQTVFREVSYANTTNDESDTRALSPTLMYIVTVWAEKHGFLGCKVGQLMDIIPPLSARAGIENHTLANTLQDEWKTQRRFQSPLVFLYNLLVRSPLYHARLSDNPSQLQSSAPYRNRWFNVYRHWATIIRHCTVNYNTMYKWICDYKKKLQYISGLSVKPNEIWSAQDVQLIHFDVTKEARTLLRNSAVRRIALTAKNPYSMTTRDVIRLRDYLMKYDFCALKHLDPNTTMVPEDEARLDKICCAAVMLVQLLIGSRFIEVLAVSDYHSKDTIVSPSVHMTENDIVVHKVAREIGQQRKEDVDCITVTTLAPKPVLFNYPPRALIGLVYTCIRPYIRRIYQDKTPSHATLSRRFHPIALRVLHKSLGDSYMQKVKEYNQRIKVSDQTNKPPLMTIGTQLLRKVYANYSYDSLSTKSVSRNAWVQTVLGNRSTSTAAVLACTNLVITRKSDSVCKGCEEGESAAVELAHLKDEIASIRKQLDRNTAVIQLGNKIAVVNRDGDEVFIEKLPRVRGKQIQQALRTARQMHDNNIKVTCSLLRRFGYGSAVVIQASRLLAEEIRQQTVHQSSDTI